MQVLVTGSNGFMAKNLLERLSRIEDVNVDTFDKNDTIDTLVSKVGSFILQA